VTIRGARRAFCGEVRGRQPGNGEASEQGWSHIVRVALDIRSEPKQLLLGKLNFWAQQASSQHDSAGNRSSG
jgi:hypothetical protein